LDETLKECFQQVQNAAFILHLEIVPWLQLLHYIIPHSAVHETIEIGKAPPCTHHCCLSYTVTITKTTTLAIFTLVIIKLTTNYFMKHWLI